MPAESLARENTSAVRVSGERLRAARIAAGLSQAWVARRLGLTRMAVCYRERDGVPSAIAIEHLSVIPDLAAPVVRPVERVSIRRSNYYTGKRLVDLVAARDR